MNIDMTPRVTLEGDIMMDLTVENSSRGSDVGSSAACNIPSFGQRTVTTRLRLRDGESNLLAGPAAGDGRRTASPGFPGAIHVPFLKQLFSSNSEQIDQTDIVMLLTPHIVRTHEITESDLKPIYIGSQQNLGVGGPPPLIAPPPECRSPQAPAGARRGRARDAADPDAERPGGYVTRAAGHARRCRAPCSVQPPAPAPAAPRRRSPPRRADAAARAAQPPARSRAAAGAAPPPSPPITSPGIGSAQVIVSPPGTTFRVGGGPYTVPMSIAGASRLSTITLTITYDPASAARARGAGGELHAGGRRERHLHQQVSGDRIDITIARAADATGASGTGLLAAMLFDAIAPGSVHADAQRRGHGSGRHGDGAALQPGHRDGAVTVNVECRM